MKCQGKKLMIMKKVVNWLEKLEEEDKLTQAELKNLGSVAWELLR